MAFNPLDLPPAARQMTAPLVGMDPTPAQLANERRNPTLEHAMANQRAPQPSTMTPYQQIIYWDAQNWIAAEREASPGACARRRARQAAGPPVRLILGGAAGIAMIPLGRARATRPSRRPRSSPTCPPTTAAWTTDPAVAAAATAAAVAQGYDLPATGAEITATMADPHGLDDRGGEGRGAAGRGGGHRARGGPVGRRGRCSVPARKPARAEETAYFGDIFPRGGCRGPRPTSTRRWLAMSRSEWHCKSTVLTRCWWA